MAKTKYALYVALILMCTVLALAGCRKGTPVQNQSSPMPLLESIPDKEIASAIIRGGARTGWEIVPTGPGTMTGSLQVRKHRADVLISYDNKGYRINYKSSFNLGYQDGKIHPSYNNWVMTLDNNIRQELAALSKK